MAFDRFDRMKDFEKKLEIAIKALNEIAFSLQPDPCTDEVIMMSDETISGTIARLALEKIYEVKKQF